MITINIARRAAMVLACVMTVSSAYAKDPADISTEDQKLSYSFGYMAGSSFKDNKDMKLDVEVFLRGVSDRLKDQSPAMTDEEMKNAMSSFQNRMMKVREGEGKQLAEKNKKESDAFLETNKAKKGIVTLPSGLQYEVLKPGTGATPKVDDTVVAHYRATLVNGKEFANTYTKNEPAKFAPKFVIPGWREALLHMKEGAKWRLFIPAELAYGDKGAPPILAPNVVSIFEVELISVAKTELEEPVVKGKEPSKSKTDDKSPKKSKP